MKNYKMERFNNTKYKLGDRVKKIRGSQWKGTVVGFYSTELTPIGYAVESDTEIGSVQIWPEKAVEEIKTIKCLKCKKIDVLEEHGFCDECEKSLEVRPDYLRKLGISD